MINISIKHTHAHTLVYSRTHLAVAVSRTQPVHLALCKTPHHYRYPMATDPPGLWHLPSPAPDKMYQVRLSTSNVHQPWSTLSLRLTNGSFSCHNLNSVHPISKMFWFSESLEKDLSNWYYQCTYLGYANFSQIPWSKAEKWQIMALYKFWI